MIEMLFRSQAPEEVRFERREIDVLAVPYDVASPVRDYDGSSYLETIAPGAFGDVATRAKRVKVFRDHRPERAVGRCVSIDPDRTDGLRATLQMSRTPLAEETLALAADGVLDVSIGFSSRAEQWSTDRTAVTRTSCWLHELSLVPLPAYETATVLAVRHQPTELGNRYDIVRAVEQASKDRQAAAAATPNLDEVLGWLAEMRYRDHPNRTHRDEASPPLTTA